MLVVDVMGSGTELCRLIAKTCLFEPHWLVRNAGQRPFKSLLLLNILKHWPASK